MPFAVKKFQGILRGSLGVPYPGGHSWGGWPGAAWPTPRGRRAPPDRSAAPGPSTTAAVAGGVEGRWKLGTLKTGWWFIPNIFSIFSPFILGKMNPCWRAYFSDGLKPPTTSRKPSKNQDEFQMFTRIIGLEDQSTRWWLLNMFIPVWGNFGWKLGD